MRKAYSTEVCQQLEDKFRRAHLHRPMKVECYDVGRELVYDVEEVAGPRKGSVRAVVEKFVGGGFAGQVYRVKIVEIDAHDGKIGGLEVGGTYAMKILIPPSGFSRLFRNFIYWLGFQGPFQLQVNPVAAKTGALWQKFFRRGAKIRFGKEEAVVDIHATFEDYTLGSCGEFSEWIDGRTWQLEVDDRLDLLKQWQKGKNIETTQLGSPEYRAKYEFMHEFVKLLHDMGGYEFARQYEWSTAKSQPNCLKRKSSEDDPSGGLVAVDFRAGLALLFFLPMSPGDFKLIFKGFGRRSLVQFDRGSINKLERFVNDHKDDFKDMMDLLDELKASESVYRDSVPDIAHNHIRLLYSRSLWSTIFISALKGWKLRNFLDDDHAGKLSHSKILTVSFFLLGLIPFLGTTVRRMIGRTDYRKHYVTLITSWDYFSRALRGKMAEKVITWHKAGRVDGSAALSISASGWRFLFHSILSLLPVGLHKILTDWEFAKAWLAYVFVRPIRLYFDAGLREQWLREMVSEGQEKHFLNHADAQTILSQIDEPFIQKYLKSLAVHLCTLPVTQVVSVLVAIIYVAMHPEMPRAQAWGIGLGIVALFQVVPVSPGSLVRGFYVVYLVAKERNFKDYNIAVFLGFFKYIGYLAFPIQMTYRYPVLARFMAGHWANQSVHIIPVFGESGALLEHWVFSLFFNWPLTIRRRIRKRIHLRKSMEKRYWHVGLCALIGAVIFGIFDFVYLKSVGTLPGLRDIWGPSLFVPLGCGAAVTLGCGGATLVERFIGAIACGGILAVFYTGLSAIVAPNGTFSATDIAVSWAWRIFIFSILSPIGAIITELKLPDPDL